MSAVKILAALVVSVLLGCGGTTRILVAILINPTTATAAAPGGTAQFTVAATFSGPPASGSVVVIWSSSDTSIATIDQSGLATCVQAGGPVTITATAPNGTTTGGSVVSGALPLTSTAQLTCT